MFKLFLGIHMNAVYVEMVKEVEVSVYLLKNLYPTKLENN